jgi:basic membrane protein A
MRLRRILTLLLTIILLTGAIAGCAQSGTTTVGETTAAAASSTTAAAAAGKIKVGVIYISPKNDGGWSQAHADGMAAAVAAIGADKIALKEIESVSDADAQQTETALNQLVADGCQIIFATSFGYMETVAKVAAENPDVKFEHCSGYMSADNLANYFAQIEQPRYLAGMIAGSHDQNQHDWLRGGHADPGSLSGHQRFYARRAFRQSEGCRQSYLDKYVV